MMHIRKLVKAGPASHTISLPKEWLARNNLTKGATLYVHEQSDSELIITPHLVEPQTTQPRTVTITVDGKNLDTIQREITSAYVNNANTIDLVGESIAKNAKEIRRMLHDFVALEIAEQNPTRISAKDLLNLSEISVDKSLKRMDIIVRTMLQDAKLTASGKDMSESVMFRDYDVNRLYFLLTRLLKSALTNPTMAAQFELTPSTVLKSWMFVNHLEQAADAIKAVCKECTKLEAKQRKDATSLLGLLEKDYLDVMKAVHEKNKQLADEVARRRQERVSNIPAITHGCNTLASLISDVARLVIDENNAEAPH